MFEFGGDPAAVLTATAVLHRQLVEHECRLLELAAAWADCHPGEALDGVVDQPTGVEVSRRPGGEGTPSVAGFCAAEFGPVCETTTGGADALIADALDLRHRLPRLWVLVVAAGVRAWKARKVAQATRHLSVAAAAAVDVAVVGSITSVSWGRFEKLLAAAVMAADPVEAEWRARAFEAERFVRAGRSTAGLKTLVARAQAGEVIWFVAMVNRLAEILAEDGDRDSADVRRSKAIGILANPARALQLLADHAPATEDTDSKGGEDSEDGDGEPSVSVASPSVDPRRLQPTVTLVVHLSDEVVRGTASAGGVARMEDVGPITVGQLRRFLRSADCRIRVLPVLDAAGMPAVDRYEVPEAMRTALLTRNPADVFPWGVCTSRKMDIDHTVPYLAPDKGGPPGQTGLAGLGPLVRFHHRVKTFGRWRLRQPEPGSYLWRSPNGWHYLVNGSGTHDLGNGLLGQTLWRAVVAAPNNWIPAA